MSPAPPLQINPCFVDFWVRIFPSDPNISAATSACSCINSCPISVSTSQLWVHQLKSQNFQPRKGQRSNLQAVHSVDDGMWVGDSDRGGTRISTRDSRTCSVLSVQDFPSGRPLFSPLFIIANDVMVDAPPQAHLRHCCSHYQLHSAA